MGTVVKVIRWAIGGFLFLLALAAFSEKEVVFGIILLLAGVLVLLIKRKKNQSFNSSQSESSLTPKSSEMSNNFKEEFNDDMWDRTDLGGNSMVVFNNLPGVDLHIYNISEGTAKYLMSLHNDFLQKLTGATTDTIELARPTRSLYEFSWIAMLEDVRCKELDDYVHTHKELYERFKDTDNVLYFDDFPGVRFVPQGVNLDILFEYPSEKANTIRKKLRKMIKETRLNKEALSSYLRLAGSYLTPEEYNDNYYRNKIQAILNAGLATLLSKAPLDIALNFLKMKELRELAKEVGVTIKARTKREFVSSLMASCDNNVLKEKISHLIPTKTLYIHEPPQEYISKEEYEWLLQYAGVLTQVIFGTYVNALNVFYNVIWGRLTGTNHFSIFNSGTACNYCKKRIGTSVTVNNNKDFKKLPPFHIGCNCEVLPE